MSTTRQKLIEAGHNLFYREGFLNVGLDRVIDTVGISKQTFYNHFECKDDLVVAVIDEHHRWWQQEMGQRVMRIAGPDPRAQIMAIFDVVDDLLRDPDYHGCIYINAAVEFPNPHHPAHKSAKKAKADGRAALVEMAERAGAMDPKELAHGLDMLIEGALITHQVDPECDACAIARRAAETLMEKHLPATV